jgi:hypothetical protein
MNEDPEAQQTASVGIFQSKINNQQFFSHLPGTRRVKGT